MRLFEAKRAKEYGCFMLEDDSEGCEESLEGLDSCSVRGERHLLEQNSQHKSVPATEASIFLETR